MNTKGILFISFILLVLSLAAVSASDLGHIAISDSHSDSSIAHVPVTVSSHDDSVIIDDNLYDVAVDDSSIDDGQSVPDDDSAIDDGDKSIPADGDDSSIDDGDKPIPADPQDDIDGDINDGDSIIINITNDTSKNNYNDKPISNVKEACGSFDDLQSLIDITPKGTVLMLSRDYKASEDNQITVNKDLIIDGQGHTIDCAGLCRALYSNSGEIVLRNLKIINGYYNSFRPGDKSNNGGAVCIEDDAKYTIENCQFINNWADDLGGAIYNGANNTLTIRDCVFNGNIVDDTYGGAIFSNGRVYSINSKFEDNKAYLDGGAIFLEASYDTRFLSNIINCTFIHNTLKGTLRNSAEGGAICSNQYLSIDNSSFKSNGEGSSCCGGAVYCFWNLTVKNSLFDSNFAENLGGAIEAYHNASLSNCTFKNNKVDGEIIHDADGGAICALGDLHITNCTFDSNYADDYGGAVSVGGNLFINYLQDDDKDYNTFFYGNIADDCEAGAIHCQGNSYIKNTLFDSNKAWTDGGAMYSFGLCFITHCLFKSNKCAGASTQCEGGAIYGEGDLTIKNSIFLSNYAEDDGGALYCEKLIQIYNSTFEGNTAEDYGGAVYSEMSVRINPSAHGSLCQFINNRALDDKGGAIYADEEDVYGYNALFISNTAYVDGGAIFSPVVNLDNCSFYYNRAEGASSKCYGGAVRANGAIVINCIFRENYSENHGGAIFTGMFLEPVKYCTFYFNQAREDGGAVYINDVGSFLFTQCTFIINRCKDQGGAIYADSSNAKINLSNNLFKGNHAETEGHVVFNYGYYGTILNNWWADNIPTEENGLLVEHKYCSSNINHVDSNPLRLAISCPGVLMVGKVAFAELYFVKSDGSEFTGEIPVLMEFVLPAEYKMKNSFITENSVLISFIPQMGGMFTISCNLFGEVVSVTSKVTGDSSFAGNSVDSGFANANSSIVKSTMVNTQFAKSLCDFPQAHDDFNSYSPWLLILSIFGL